MTKDYFNQCFVSLSLYTGSPHTFTVPLHRIFKNRRFHSLAQKQPYSTSSDSNASFSLTLISPVNVPVVAALASGQASILLFLRFQYFKSIGQHFLSSLLSLSFSSIPNLSLFHINHSCLIYFLFSKPCDV